MANFGGNAMSMVLGNGDGTFRVARPSPSAAIPCPSAVADFNGDGAGPGRRQLRQQHRLRAARQRRRDLRGGAELRRRRQSPAPVAARRLQRTATDRSDLAVANYGSARRRHDVSVSAGQRRRHASAGGDLRGRAGSARAWRVGDLNGDAKLAIWPWPTPARTPSPCCWATAVGPSRRRCTSTAGAARRRCRRRRQRRRQAGPGRDQLRLQQRLGAAGHRRWHLPGAAQLRDRGQPHFRGRGRPQRRRQAGPGRGQHQRPLRVRAAGQRRRDLRRRPSTSPWAALPSR